MPIFKWLSQLENDLPARAQVLTKIPGGIVDAETIDVSRKISEIIWQVRQAFYDLNSPFTFSS